jgi:carboxylesterase type B
LQKITADKLLGASGGGGTGRGGGAVVDGHSIPKQTWHPKAPEDSTSIPMIIGNDKDESTLFSLRDEDLFSLDQDGLRTRIIMSGFPEQDISFPFFAFREVSQNDEMGILSPNYPNDIM